MSKGGEGSVGPLAGKAASATLTGPGSPAQEADAGRGAAGSCHKGYCLRSINEPSRFGSIRPQTKNSALLKSPDWPPFCPLDRGPPGFLGILAHPPEKVCQDTSFTFRPLAENLLQRFPPQLRKTLHDFLRLGCH